MPLPLATRARDFMAKWQTRATAAQADYERAVALPAVWDAWKTNAVAAAPTYNAAMQEVVAQNRWGSAIQRTDPRIYGENVRMKAPRRVQGIQAGAPKWLANMQPIFETLDRVRPTLPARGPRMSAENINRFNMTIRAIHEAALARRGAAPAPAPAAFGYIPFPPEIRYPTVSPVSPPPPVYTPMAAGVGAGYGSYGQTPY